MKKTSLPSFGVGPIYVGVCIAFTFLGIYLGNTKSLLFIPIFSYQVIVIFISVFLIGLGIYCWIQAVIVSKINQNATNNHLLTTGIYSKTRNPTYAAFLFVSSGVLNLYNNLVLWIIPIFLYIFLTVLMKYTEEKWLKEIFQKDYELYCKKVNRVFLNIFHN